MDNLINYCCDTYSKNEHKSQSEQLKRSLVRASMQLYPNPASDEGFVLQFDAVKDAQSKVEIYNMIGQLVYEKQFRVDANMSHFHLPIILSKLSMPSGTYAVHLKNGNNNFMIKFSKQ